MASQMVSCRSREVRRPRPRPRRCRPPRSRRASHPGRHRQGLGRWEWHRQRLPADAWPPHDAWSHGATRAAGQRAAGRRVARKRDARKRGATTRKLAPLPQHPRGPNQQLQDFESDQRELLGKRDALVLRQDDPAHLGAGGSSGGLRKARGKPEVRRYCWLKQGPSHVGDFLPARSLRRFQ